MISTALACVRKLAKVDNVYLFEVTSYRDTETGKVEQRSEYKGNDIIMKIYQPCVNLGNGSIAVRFGFISSQDDLTNIREANKNRDLTDFICSQSPRFL